MARGAPERSQLTIFYDGTVNVYNDVPSDKAHAIMLLLGSNNNHQPAAAVDASSPIPSAVRDSEKPGVPIRPVLMSRSNSFVGNPHSELTAAPLGSAPGTPRQEISTIGPPQSPCSVSSSQQQQPTIRKRTQAELPFARKASLARFLEKRKDRLHNKPVVDSEENASSAVSKKLKSEDGELVLGSS